MLLMLDIAITGRRRSSMSKEALNNSSMDF